MTNKKNLSERDICTKHILPALKKAGWDVERQIREEVFFTDLASFASKMLPYRGLGSGIRRSLREYKDIDFTDDREGNKFVAIIRRRL